jgi:hypothetical protein
LKLIYCIFNSSYPCNLYQNEYSSNVFISYMTLCIQVVKFLQCCHNKFISGFHLFPFQLYYIFMLNNILQCQLLLLNLFFLSTIAWSNLVLSLKNIWN